MLQGTVQVLFAFAPMKVLLPVVAQERYGDGAYGILMACVPAGMILGSLLAMRLRPRRDGVTAMHAVAPTAAVMACLAVDVPLVVFAVVQVVAWAGISVFAVLWFSSLQRAYPPAIQGRVFSVEQLATFALDPIGLALAPAAAAAVGVADRRLGRGHRPARHHVRRVPRPRRRPLPGPGPEPRSLTVGHIWGCGD